LLLCALAVGGYFGYQRYGHVLKAGNADNVALDISAKHQVVAGEEFAYTLEYANNEKQAIEGLEITVAYPADFIFLASDPQPATQSGVANNVWRLGRLEAGQKGVIEIKGKLVGVQGANALLSAELAYRPEAFNGQFKKSARFENVISDIGLEFTFDHYSSVLVGKENEIAITYKASDNYYLGTFKMLMNSMDNLQILSGDQSLRPGLWEIKDASAEAKDLRIRFKFKDKVNPTEEIGLRMEYEEGGRSFLVYEKKIPLEVMKSDLNLNLIINGSRADQGIDFGQSLNYSLTFANKGETTMKNIVLMAVIEGDFVDWGSLGDANGGKVRGTSIVWDKDSLPMLEELASGQEGVIDFSLKVSEQPESIDPSKNYQVKSYAQFNIGGILDDNASGTASTTKPAPDDMNKDTRSNTITNKINSNLELSEQLRYFNEDNLAVGYGPLPPRVGQTTGYKVYWRLENGLHELNNLVLEASLPDYVRWDAKSTASVGTLRYDEYAHKVIWTIGRLPISEYEIAADFGLSIVPQDGDADKIMTLINGTMVTAVDTVTGAEIKKTSKVKTTRLEDDDIAADLNDGGQISR
jgi:hypothetical protein